MMVRVNVCYVEQYGSGEDWPTRYDQQTLVSVIAWFQKKLNQIPSKFRPSAFCDIDQDSFYDSTYATISIWYERPETSEEASNRRAKEQAKSNAKRAEELAILDALKAKYPENK